MNIKTLLNSIVVELTMLRTDRIESKFLFWRGLYYEGSIFPKRERERERERKRVR